MTLTASGATVARQRPPQPARLPPRRDIAWGRPSVARARIPAPIPPDVSRIPVHPKKIQAAAWPAPIQRCGIGSSCDCPPHEKLAGVRRDLETAISGGGAPLPHATRGAMERRFASDFASVRVHTGAGADRAAAALHARALTSGTDILFRSGAYRPGTPGGDRLLAHELSHVLQQRSGPVSGTDIGGGIAISDPSDRFERQAESAAAQQLVVQRDDADKPSAQPAAGQCIPDPGIPSSDCGLYLSNAYWLPLAYVVNATCACSATPNVPTANCVRKFLQDRLRATPGWLIAAATAAKALPPGQYEEWVQAFLTPRIYSDHVDAYRHCCCPHGPAPYPDWMAVTTVPIPSCSLTGWFINHFGSCTGTPGAW
jgi:Domain of unknown function (DUF4157)